ncbi:767_t:CDS:2 [Racocetra persica]|uniref:767_t:CDS:1 n=1 Tax=Racocetra persica TaxID=160502 RepID=A0ACA9M8F9_9GLOM|nr:767_t:CDS:2 [Racocetra persica]
MAETDKSYLIKVIRSQLCRIAEIGSELSVLVLAPTGAVAYNINGATIYLTLFIPLQIGNNIDLKIRCRMLNLIDIQLQQAFPKHKNEPFGGRSIIMIRDFGQLLLVLDFLIYAANVSRDPLSNSGIISYGQFREHSVAKVFAKHTSNQEAKKADFDIAKSLEAQFLLAKAVFIAFDNYNSSAIKTLEGVNVIPIVPIQCTWESKSGVLCSRTQIPVCLVWAITCLKFVPSLIFFLNLSVLKGFSELKTIKDYKIEKVKKND